MGLFSKKTDKSEKAKPEDKPKAKEKDNSNAPWAASKEKPKEASKPAPKPAASKPAAKSAAKPAPKSDKEPKVWHIIRREDKNMWEVRLEGSPKALKLFKTKAEAEDYVKVLKDNNEGSKVISHKKTGELQKK